MSLTHPFGNCEKHNVAQIKLITPAKTDFYSRDASPCFNKKKAPIAECSFSEPHKATLSGTAFDYIARFLIAEKVKQYIGASLNNLVAEHIFLYNSVKWISHEKSRESGHKEYTRYINRISNLMQNDSLMKNDEAVTICVLFAKMEQESRAGRQSAPIFRIAPEDYEIVQDVRKLALAFITHFLPIVNKDSTIIFNPHFGIGSRVVGGADADLYVDGTLYDFKVKKDNSWSGVIARQLVGYYVLDSIAKDAEDSHNDLSEHQINRVAIYNARFGECDYYDTSKIDKPQLELVKEKIRHEFLLRKLRNYDYSRLDKFDIPLTEDELFYCSDDSEFEIEIWKDIDVARSVAIANAWNKLTSFLSRIDTNTVFKQIVYK